MTELGVRLREDLARRMMYGMSRVFLTVEAARLKAENGMTHDLVDAVPGAIGHGDPDVPQG